ncbi:MAG: CPBP family intramembrane metalloprotease [Caldilineae bacterium]|nr:MAG: CPBP family intramembrane metalloprotease [Caldilineae bacterium]
MADIIIMLLLFSPLMVILWLANKADRQQDRATPERLWGVLAYLILAIFWVGFILGGLLVTVMGAALRSQPLTPEVLAPYEALGLKPEGVRDLLASLPMVGMGMWLPSILGLVLLLPPVRRLVARILAIDPSRVVHAVALSYTMLVVVNLWVTLAFGIGNLADITAAGGGIESTALVQTVWAQEIAFALTALIGVGWLAGRGWRATLHRLGLVRPTGRQLLTGVVLGVVMMLALIPIDYFTQTTGIGFDEDVTRLGEQVIGPLTQSLAGILTLGVGAALGEELIFRGALQPRFGLVFTSLLFTLLHSNYGLSLSTLIVLLIGLILGWVRNRYNTTSSMVVHAVYNMAIGLMTYLALWPEW